MKAPQCESGERGGGARGQRALRLAAVATLRGAYYTA